MNGPLPETDIVHPMMKSWRAKRSSPEELWKMLSTVKEQAMRLSAVEKELRFAIGKMASIGDTLTRRVVGNDIALKVTMPSDRWSQPVLKEAVANYPELAKDYIRIASYAAIAKEVKKLAGTSSEIEGFDDFRELVLSAREESTAPPTVSLEKSSQ